MKTILPLKNTQITSKVNRNTSVIKKALLGLAMCSVCVVSQAADNTSQNNGNGSYTIKIIKKQVPTANKQQDSMSSATSAKKYSESGSRDSRTLRLNEGGVIWVSNDPVSLTPTLSVSTSTL